VAFPPDFLRPNEVILGLLGLIIMRSYLVSVTGIVFYTNLDTSIFSVMVSSFHISMVDIL